MILTPADREERRRQRAEQAVPQTASLSPEDQQQSSAPATTGHTIGGYIREIQSGIRKEPISPELHKVLDYAAAQTGMKVQVFSGGQESNRPGEGTGSTRHNHGNAADLNLVGPDGKEVDFSTPEGQKIFADFATAAAAAGATGIGAAGDYMGTKAMHVGFGTRGTWGAGGHAKNAPAWLSKAVQVGWDAPADKSLLSKIGDVASTVGKTAVGLVTGVGPNTEWTARLPKARPADEQQASVISDVFGDGAPPMAFAGQPAGTPAADAISSVFGPDAEPVAQIGPNRFFAPKGSDLSKVDLVDKHTPPEVVKALQTSLAAAGINPGPIDGKLGPSTKAAIKSFQQVNGLTPDGKAGPATMNAIHQGAGGAPLPQARPEMQAVRPEGPPGGFPAAAGPPDMGASAVANPPTTSPAVAQQANYPADTPSLGWDSRLQSPTMQEAWQSGAQANPPAPVSSASAVGAAPDMGGSSPDLGPGYAQMEADRATARSTADGRPVDAPIPDQNDFKSSPAFQPEVPKQGLSWDQVQGLMNGLGPIGATGAAVTPPTEMTDGQGISVPPNGVGAPPQMASAPMPPDMQSQISAGPPIMTGGAQIPIGGPTPVPTTSVLGSDQQAPGYPPDQFATPPDMGGASSLSAPPIAAAPASTGPAPVAPTMTGAPPKTQKSWGDILTEGLGKVAAAPGKAITSVENTVQQGATDMTKHITDMVKSRIFGDPIQNAFENAHAPDGQFDNHAFWSAIESNKDMTESRQALAARLAAQGNLANKNLGAPGGSLAGNGPGMGGGSGYGYQSQITPGSPGYSHAVALTDSTGGAH